MPWLLPLGPLRPYTLCSRTPNCGQDPRPRGPGKGHLVKGPWDSCTLQPFMSCVTLDNSLSFSESWFSCMLDEDGDSCPTKHTHTHTRPVSECPAPLVLGCLECSAKPTTGKLSMPASLSPTGWCMPTALPTPSSTTSSVVSGLETQSNRGWQQSPGQQSLHLQSRLNKAWEDTPAPSWGL